MGHPDTEFGDEGQDDSRSESPPVGKNTSQTGALGVGDETGSVTTLQRAGFPLLPRAAACHDRSLTNCQYAPQSIPTPSRAVLVVAFIDIWVPPTTVSA